MMKQYYLGRTEDLTYTTMAIRRIEEGFRLSRVIVPVVFFGIISGGISRWFRKALAPFLNGEHDTSFFIQLSFWFVQTLVLPLGILIITFMVFKGAFSRQGALLKKAGFFARQFWIGYLWYIVILNIGYSLAYGPESLLSLLFAVPAIYILHLYCRMAWMLSEAQHLIEKDVVFPTMGLGTYSTFAYFLGIGTKISSAPWGLLAFILGTSAFTFEFIYIQYILIFNAGSPIFLSALEQPPLLFLILFLFAFLGFLIGGLLRRVARVLNQRGYEEVRLTDLRKPILFLRSFQNDQVYFPTTYRSPIQRMFDPGGLGSCLEHILIEETFAFGPMFAIGRPKDRFPPFGAQRRYIDTMDWQSVVLSMTQEAELILLAVDRTEGILWEIDQIKKRNLQSKTIFIFPPGKRSKSSVVSITDFEMMLDSKLRIGPMPTGELIAIILKENDTVVFIAREPDQTSYRLAIRRALAELLPVQSQDTSIRKNLVELFSSKSPNSPVGRIEYATFGARVAGYFLDGLFFNLLCTPIFAIYYGLLIIATEIQEISIIIIALFAQLIGIVLVVHFYFVRPIHKTGQTWGKKLVKVRIIDATSRKYPSKAQVWLRLLAYSASALILMLGFFMPLLTKKSQALHDMMVNTLVIKSNS